MELNPDKLPEHVAIIMDGNGRWAKERGNPRVFGHKNGVKSVDESVKTAAELGIQYLTLFAFSTENWDRPKEEISLLMELLLFSLKKELKKLIENDIRLNTIGDLSLLPKKISNELILVKEKTKNNKKMVLTLAINYGGKEEITHAIKTLSGKVKNNEIDVENINHNLIKKFLYTNDMPDVDLLIRTSGEHRISNFLLWQIAYAELYFTETLWPDFRKEHLYEALLNYQNRERRFGKTSEQINIHE